MTRVALLGHGFTAEPKRKPAAFCHVREVVAHGLMAWRRAAWWTVAPWVAAAVLVACALATPTKAADDQDFNARLLMLVNAARADAGLRALTLEPHLKAAACAHAQDLARGGTLSHRGSDGSDLSNRLARNSYVFAMAAENLAAGPTTPDETVRLWLASPGHRRNILTPDFRQAGFARVPTDGGAIWVLELGAPRAAAAGVLAPADSGKPPADVRGDNRLTCY